MKRISRLAFTALAITAFAFQAPAGDLKGTVIGAIPVAGQFLMSVFDSEETWMKRPIADKTIPVSPQGSGGTVFSIPPGTYGVSIVHDANADGKINTNVFGIPTEAFGFSNNAKARFGPPKFKHAKFEFGANGADVTIRLKRAD